MGPSGPKQDSSRKSKEKKRLPVVQAQKSRTIVAESKGKKGQFQLDLDRFFNDFPTFFPTLHGAERPQQPFLDIYGVLGPKGSNDSSKRPPASQFLSPKLISLSNRSLALILLESTAMCQILSVNRIESACVLFCPPSRGSCEFCLARPAYN